MNSKSEVSSYSVLASYWRQSRKRTATTNARPFPVARPTAFKTIRSATLNDARVLGSLVGPVGEGREAEDGRTRALRVSVLRGTQLGACNGCPPGRSWPALASTARASPTGSLCRGAVSGQEVTRLLETAGARRALRLLPSVPPAASDLPLPSRSTSGSCCYAPSLVHTSPPEFLLPSLCFCLSFFAFPANGFCVFHLLCSTHLCSLTREQ